MDLRLEAKRVLVTGGSAGIGLAVARRFAAEGAHLALVARKEAELCSAADALRSEYGVEVRIFATDLAEGEAARVLACEFPETDILVNNAGAIPRGNIEEIDEERWRAAWDLKVFGYVNMTREFYRGMRQRRSGVIINVIGAGGERPDAQFICGSTGNAALMAFTRALGGRSADHGVRVLGVNPGFVSTERAVGLLRKEADERFGDAERWTELIQFLPFGRAATPQEIAAMVVFAASDLSAYTTGTIITVDGGLAQRLA